MAFSSSLVGTRSWSPTSTFDQRVAADVSMQTAVRSVLQAAMEALERDLADMPR